MEYDTIKNIRDVLNTQIETDKVKLNELLVDNKIIISIVKGPTVITKVIKTIKTLSKQKRTLSATEIEKLKSAKKILKNNLEALYLVTLAIRFSETLKKTSIKDIPVGERDVVEKSLREVFATMYMLFQKVKKLTLNRMKQLGII